MIVVRLERAEDVAAVRDINMAAFDQVEESRLVDVLRTAASPILSLVAERGNNVVGHIFFTPVNVEAEDTDWQALALGPMAVLPKVQQQGVGGALVEAGLRRCEELDTPAVFVLGHANYYPRFGFEPASKYGCRCTWDVPDEVFMVKQMAEQLPGGGLVRYHPAFNDLT